MAGVDERAAFAAAFEHMRAPFKWGLRSDCTAACTAFAAIHGIDPLARCADHYSTALGAARILRRAGGYLAWCRETFDLPETPAPRAGDLVLIESADALGAALAVCIRPGEFAAKSEAGLVVVKTLIRGAWRCHF